jgi:hypothetical protein
MIDLTESEFDSIEFIENHLDDNASWGGTMFETYGDEYDFICKQDTNKIWTLVDADEGIAVIAGWAYANRIGYFISKYPWTDELTQYYIRDDKGQ